MILGAGALVVGSASSVSAQTTASPAPAKQPLSTSLTGDAKASYESGKLLLDDHDYAGASAKFRAAYDASHDARLLWNLAVCEKEQRHYARASVLVDRFIADAGSTVSPEQLAQAKATQAALKQFFSMVTFAVQPAGAVVTVDGEDVGHAPLTAPVAIDVGKHTVHVQHDGFAPGDQTIDISGTSATTVTVSLTAVASVAYLSISPSDAEDAIVVDGHAVGKGAWAGTLTPGPHEVKVTRDGMQPKLAEISLAANEHRSLDVSLEKEKSASLLPWIIGGGVVVVAGAVIGGYFLFKPSDTQQPFPNTQLQNISLSSVRVGLRR